MRSPGIEPGTRFENAGLRRFPLLCLAYRSTLTKTHLTVSFHQRTPARLNPMLYQTELRAQTVKCKRRNKMRLKIS